MLRWQNTLHSPSINAEIFCPLLKVKAMQDKVWPTPVLLCGRSGKQGCMAGRWDREGRSMTLPSGSRRVSTGSTPHKTAVFIVLLSIGSLVQFRTSQIPHHLSMGQGSKPDYLRPKQMQYNSEMLLSTWWFKKHRLNKRTCTLPVKKNTYDILSERGTESIFWLLTFCQYSMFQKY